MQKVMTDKSFIKELRQDLLLIKGTQLNMNMEIGHLMRS